MTYKAFTDKLLDLCEYRAEEIAKRWWKAVSENSRTTSYQSLPAEECLQQATFIYKNLKRLFFSGSPYQEVQQFLEKMRYIEDIYAGGIPLHEAIYALIIMRRHIWLYADLQATFFTASDAYQGIESINRTLLLFDYAMYLVSQKYHEMDESL